MAESNKRGTTDLFEILEDPNKNYEEYIKNYMVDELKKTNSSVELLIWETFKKTYNRIYFTTYDENPAKEIFFNNLEYIRKHNKNYKRGTVSYKLGINKFFAKRLNYITNNSPPYSHDFPRNSPVVPDSVDWRDGRDVSFVRDQGKSDASCWAFAVTGALECHLSIHRNINVSLSVQQLIDCLGPAQIGWADEAYDHIKNKGLQTESDYPYEQHRSRCRYDPRKTHYTVEGFDRIDEGDEQQLKEVVALKGPVVVQVDSRGDFIFYKSGIYYNGRCTSDKRKLNHSAVVVGYGTERGHDYWLIKNSWGADWGDNGHMKIARKRNNHCGIASLAVYPIV